MNKQKPPKNRKRTARDLRFNSRSHRNHWGNYGAGEPILVPALERWRVRMAFYGSPVTE